MFSKSQASKPLPKAGSLRPRDDGTPAAPSIISVDMRISGDLQTNGDVQVDGVVDGDIQSGSLTIGKTAEINGEIVADSVRVWGRVNGRIRGKEVILCETADINGDILHDSLEIARGANVEGMVKRHAPAEDERPSKVNLVVSDKETAPAAAVSAAS